ncbi:hypothetical protein R3P38DRAFT_3302197 [Favolaschia claudopus]|uniref:Fido domain-containing protein n=1 Tax=Favolaschia claudopus TaxID=2862362 RepID=A0AAW0EIC6_9AGAR
MTSLLEIPFEVELKINPPFLAWPHPNPSEVETLLLRQYGAQTSAPFLSFEESIYGVLSTFQPARLLQLNRFVTGGTTPSGDVNGFQLSFRNKTRIAMNTTGVENSGNTIYETEHSIRAIIETASALALDIRTNQYFKDGNHRTSILALILYLAEHGIVLTSSFYIYRAYTIVSARFHPGNESNTLDATAHADAQRHLVRYLRRRTVRGVATIDYLQILAETVRQLPITVARVEEVGANLRNQHRHRQQLWNRLNWAQKVVLKWTFPDLKKGWNKIR